MVTKDKQCWNINILRTSTAQIVYKTSKYDPNFKFPIITH